MSHTYLIDLYDLIDQRIEEASEELRSGTSEGGGTRFQQGRCEVLTEQIYRLTSPALHILHFIEHLFNNQKAALPEGRRVQINVKRGQQLVG